MKQAISQAKHGGRMAYVLNEGAPTGFRMFVPGSIDTRTPFNLGGVVFNTVYVRRRFCVDGKIPASWLVDISEVIDESEEEAAFNARKYHIVAINEHTGDKTQLTGYPMTHAECCTMKSKITAHPARRIQLEEAVA